MSMFLVRAGALIALAAASTLSVHASAEARRFESTVVVGRVTAGGRPVQGTSVSAAGRQSSTLSASDGRYALTVPRTAARDRVTILARRIGYEPWQRAVELRGDTVRLDIALGQTTMQLEGVVVTGAKGQAERSRAAADSHREITGAVASVSVAPSNTTGMMAQSRIRRDAPGAPPGIRRPREPGNTEAYDRIDENPFRPVSVAPLSTFSVDVDRASYANVRRYLNQGTLPPKDAVRVEELVNYFPYGDATPARGDVPLRITTEVAAAPWNARHDLVRIALRAREVDMRRAPAANLVFLVDVSGSMQGPTRLPLVKKSLALLPAPEYPSPDRIVGSSFDRL
jgi:Ca-activated chloride channel family protein